MNFSEISSKYTEYRNLLAPFRERVKSARLWYRQAQTEYQGQNKAAPGEPESRSGHIFNAVQYKHADLMDNYPRANVLPRESRDEESAKVLTEVLPFVFERCGFRKTYCLNLYEKIIVGTSVYGVFYNELANGRKGEIEIKKIEVLNFTWQPDAASLSDSRYVFYDTFMDEADFKVLYGDRENIAVQSQYDETKDVQSEDVSHTVIITDCYYKKLLSDGRSVLHFVKFSGNEILFSSEDKEEYKDGFYKHGMYPFVFDILHPVPGEIYGFGLVDIAKDMQGYIDRLDYSINRSALLTSRNRYFLREHAGVNEDEFLDASRDIVHVQGDVGEVNLRPIDVKTLPEFVVVHRQNKIEELKEICGNRDFAQGGSAGGVTSGSAITALQNASDKLVRDAVNFSYISYEEIVRLAIELIREFYDEPRMFRIVGEDGSVDFKSISKSSVFADVENSVYDISISVEKNNPYSRAFHNQLIMELSGAGLLDPQNFEKASFVLKNLNFDGKDKLIRDLQEVYGNMKAQPMPTPEQSGAGGMGPLVEIPLDNSGELSGGEAMGGNDPLVEIPLG